MRQDRWNTYDCRGYTHDVANDPRSQGGVHLHQVKRGSGGWMCRVLQSNGRYEAAGPVWEVDTAKGIALFEQAKGY